MRAHSYKQLQVAQNHIDSSETVQALRILQQACKAVTSMEKIEHENSAISNENYGSDKINFQWDIARKIESSVDSIAYTFDNPRSGTNESESSHEINIVEQLLVDIANLYKTIVVPLVEDSRKVNKVIDEEDIADLCLDWAIASKRANKINDCIQAHECRMQIYPHLCTTDAVRLLGFEAEKEGFIQGIFETDIESFHTINDKTVPTAVLNDHTYTCHRPSSEAIIIGKAVREIFLDAHYDFNNCQTLLNNFLKTNSVSESKETTSSTSFQNASRQIFSANSFFNHRDRARQQLLEQRDTKRAGNSFDVLTILFLFGLSVRRGVLEGAIGESGVKTLLSARLLCSHPIDKNQLIAEVQIYALDPNTFNENGHNSNDDILLFMTDWPIESLRLQRDAIMPVGYDTLELLALSSGISNNDHENIRLLDLCCGCGIQGIFTATHMQQNIQELVSMDINRRACHFVTGNSCINDLARPKNMKQQFPIFAVQSDLYLPIINTTQDKRNTINHSPIGKFDYILCNPPFVAVPVCNDTPTLSPALYSAGGGELGMGILAKILKDLFEHLKGEKISSSLLMVTELPNVQECCTMLKEQLDEIMVDQARIRVAYVEDDVETVEEYAREREGEDGRLIERRWDVALSSGGFVYNRALVLISIGRVRHDDILLKLSSLKDVDDDDVHSISSVDEADEEDKFLTKEGICFMREHLL